MENKIAYNGYTIIPMEFDTWAMATSIVRPSSLSLKPSLTSINLSFKGEV
jgi:hypothetical protein